MPEEEQEATQKPKVQRKHPRRLSKDALLAQAETGLRWCLKCQKLLPPELFRTDGKRTNTCIPHIKAEKKRNHYGTHEKRAFNNYRVRIRQDSLLFGPRSVYFSKESVTMMLTQEQMQNYTKYCILPKFPDRPFTPENAVAVTTDQRLYLIAKWRRSHDVEEYLIDLKLLLGDKINAGITA
jgi:hypothetical protein